MVVPIHSVRQAFTLIELLLVIGIIAILAGIVIVAINPTKQLASARDAQRRSHVNALINAVYQFSIDNTSGHLPGYLTGATVDVNYQICNCNAQFCPLRATGGCGLPVAGSSMINIRELTGSYIVAIPSDPRATATASGSRYLIRKDARNRITISSPDVETAGTTISVTR
jgi:prepilin-type N-terminal cleavage/methylation domain-containing protein